MIFYILLFSSSKFPSAEIFFISDPDGTEFDNWTVDIQTSRHKTPNGTFAIFKNTLKKNMLYCRIEKGYT